jgi:hypothetical protein
MQKLFERREQAMKGSDSTSSVSASLSRDAPMGFSFERSRERFLATENPEKMFICIQALIYHFICFARLGGLSGLTFISRLPIFALPTKGGRL